MIIDNHAGIVCLAHPLSAPTPEGHQANLQRARRWVRWCIDQYGAVVVATWLYYCEVLDDHNPEHRALGMRHSLCVLNRCDALWLVGGHVSSGMRTEAEQSYHDQQPVLDFTALGEEPPVVASALADVPLWIPS